MLAAASSQWKVKVYVIFVAVEMGSWCGLGESWNKNRLSFTQKWCEPVKILRFAQNIFKCKKLEFLLSHKTFFLKDSLLFAKKPPPTKLSHSLKYITYCPPKSEQVFSKTPTNLYAVKPPSRASSKYSELHGTRRCFCKNFLIAQDLRPNQKIHRSEFWTALRSPEVSRPLGYFWVTFSYKRKSNIKTSLICFSRKKALFPDFSRTKKPPSRPLGKFSEKGKFP